MPRWWSRDLRTAETTFTEALDRGAVGDREAIARAVELARESHRHQTRGGASPFLCHPLRVATSLVLESGVSDPEIVQAALLHDTAEDGGVPPARLGAEFGERVRRIVEPLTRKTAKSRRGDRSGDPYVRGIEGAGKDAVLLKLHDKLDNLRDVRFHPDVDKRLRCLRETTEVYAPLAERLAPPLRDRLTASIRAAARGEAFETGRPGDAPA